MIGVTIIKSAESGSPGQYLNIYSENWDVVADSKPFQLENLAQNCVSLLLDFVPGQLSHCRAGDTVVWLLGGSDHKVLVHFLNFDIDFDIDWRTILRSEIAAILAFRRKY